MYQHVEPKPKTQHTGHHQRPKKIAIGKKIAIEKKKNSTHRTPPAAEKYSHWNFVFVKPETNVIPAC
jgi:hypothetical protein